MASSIILAGGLNGLLLGGLYAVAALGLSLVFGVMRQINVAHGELLVLSAYLNVSVIQWLGWDPLLAVVVVAPALFVIGYGIQRFLINPVTSMGDDPPLLTAFGLSILLQNAFILVWSADSRTLASSYALKGIEWFGLQIPLVYLISFFLALIILLAFHWWLKTSMTGKAIRAASLDPTTAQTLGMNPQKLYAITYGIAAAICAVGGSLIGMTFSIVPTSGLNWLLKGFVVVILGGLGSMNGTLLAAFLLGMMEGVGGSFVGTGYREMIGYILFLLVLLIRPSGLAGRNYA
ncbi:branched-chain amino acid ABC transporter permease [Brevibacillus fluminis]|uniref:branched-chain amino acid ABC transporter permease n=1 Tax=Brevibacillus fluminis TaxID=511487 RepID=UPI003F8BBC43